MSNWDSKAGSIRAKQIRQQILSRPNQGTSYDTGVDIEQSLEGNLDDITLQP